MIDNDSNFANVEKNLTSMIYPTYKYRCLFTVFLELHEIILFLSQPYCEGAQG